MSVEIDIDFAAEAAAVWIDELLNEALDESFPASDPLSSLKFD